jgi:hypothetical protein
MNTSKALGTSVKPVSQWACGYNTEFAKLLWFMVYFITLSAAQTIRSLMKWQLKRMHQLWCTPSCSYPDNSTEELTKTTNRPRRSVQVMEFSVYYYSLLHKALKPYRCTLLIFRKKLRYRVNHTYGNFTPGFRLLTKAFCGFPQSIQINAWIVPWNRSVMLPPQTFMYQWYDCGESGSVVGSGTMLQAERFLFQFPMRSLDFSRDLIFPAALWPSGQLSF